MAEKNEQQQSRLFSLFTRDGLKTFRQEGEQVRELVPTKDGVKEEKTLDSWLMECYNHKH